MVTGWQDFKLPSNSFSYKIVYLNLYMETLIVQPSSKEQLTALKAIMKALKVDFTTAKESDVPYSAEFIAKMKKGEEDIKAGRTTKIEPADIWNLG